MLEIPDKDIENTLAREHYLQRINIAGKTLRQAWETILSQGNAFFLRQFPHFYKQDPRAAMDSFTVYIDREGRKYSEPLDIMHTLAHIAMQAPQTPYGEAKLDVAEMRFYGDETRNIHNANTRIPTDKPATFEDYLQAVAKGNEDIRTYQRYIQDGRPREHLAIAYATTPNGQLDLTHSRELISLIARATYVDAKFYLYSTTALSTPTFLHQGLADFLPKVPAGIFWVTGAEQRVIDRITDEMIRERTGKSTDWSFVDDLNQKRKFTAETVAEHLRALR